MDQSYHVPLYSYMPELSQAERWQRLRPIISTLYVEECRKLNEVIEILRTRHGFDANENQVKYHLRRWKLKRSISTKTKQRMFHIIEERAARGKFTSIEYRHGQVDSQKLYKKLYRHARDQPNKNIVRRRLVNTEQGHAPLALHVAPGIFIKWSLPYGALRHSHVSPITHNSPLPGGPSPGSDIVAKTPSVSGPLSPPADSPLSVSKATQVKTAMERAYLFLGGKHTELIKLMESRETIVMSTWLYQFWMYAFRTARHWGKGPRNWTKDLLDLDKHMEKLSISAAPTPGTNNNTIPGPASTPTPASFWLTDGVTPSILCNWGVHVPYLSYEPVVTPDSEDSRQDPFRNWKRWPESWANSSFVSKLKNGLQGNLFSNIDEDDLPVALPRLLQSANLDRDELLVEALGFSIIGRNVDVLFSIIRKIRRARTKVDGIYPFHLATSYLSGSDPCCNILSFLVCRPSLFPLKDLYLDDREHTVLDNLMVTILKSHSRCVPAAVDDNMRHVLRFAGEEVDICGRWDADSDELRALFAKGQARIPFEWKHKFCHTSVQVICHCSGLLFGHDWSPDINSPSGLFRKICPFCGHEMKLLPLHAAAMTAFVLADQGCEGEDLFGMVACLLCLLRNGADPSLKADISPLVLFGGQSPASCLHESYDAVQFVDHISTNFAYRWSPRLQSGWYLFSYILNISRSLKDPAMPSADEQDVTMWNGYQAMDYFMFGAVDGAEDLVHRRQLDESQVDGNAMSVDGEISWCHSCGQTNHFKGSTELRDLWASVQAELLTYRRLRDGDDWMSKNFDMHDIVANVAAGNGLQIGFLQKGFLRDFCDCGSFGEARSVDFACVDEVCREYISNLEEWERTTYLWCPEIVDDDEEGVEFGYASLSDGEWEESEDDDDNEDDSDVQQVEEGKDGFTTIASSSEAERSHCERPLNSLCLEFNAFPPATYANT